MLGMLAACAEEDPATGREQLAVRRVDASIPMLSGTMARLHDLRLHVLDASSYIGKLK